MNDREIIEAARKNVKNKKSFYKHFNAFLLVGAFLFLINIMTSPDDLWFFFPLIGWAPAVVGHYLKVFGIPSFRGEKWEEKQLEIEINKLKSQNSLLSSQEDFLDDTLELKEQIELRKEYDADDLV